MIGFTKAMNDFFGRKPGQSIGEFANELKALTHQDRLDFIAMFMAIGIEVQAPLPIAA